MQKQALLSLSVNLIIIAFLITGLPLPSSFGNKLEHTLFPIVGPGTRLVGAGGNLAQEFTAMCILDHGNGYSSGFNTQQVSETATRGNKDITYERYKVHGDTLAELQAAVYDLENGSGPLDEEEGKRYAAYAQATYEIDFKPAIRGWWEEDGQVAVELGGNSTVKPKITMLLPEFQPNDRRLQPACDIEEARLEEHEMEHVAIFHLCSEQLQDSLKDIRVIGRGRNLWVALISANMEMDRKLETKLNDTVNCANIMNEIIDALTCHGLAF